MGASKLDLCAAAAAEAADDLGARLWNLRRRKGFRGVARSIASRNRLPLSSSSHRCGDGKCAALALSLAHRSHRRGHLRAFLSSEKPLAGARLNRTKTSAPVAGYHIC